jgi:hypothetical protein
LEIVKVASFPTHLNTSPTNPNTMATSLPTEEHATPGHSTLKGLKLANHHFGPLLSPVTATEAQWSAYAEHRQTINSAFGNVLDHPEQSINTAIAAVEQDLNLATGTLQKCVSVVESDVMMDDESVSCTRVALNGS